MSLVLNTTNTTVPPPADTEVPQCVFQYTEEHLKRAAESDSESDSDSWIQELEREAAKLCSDTTQVQRRNLKRKIDEDEDEDKEGEFSDSDSESVDEAWLRSLEREIESYDLFGSDDESI